jgi:hypothetical protein
MAYIQSSCSDTISEKLPKVPLFGTFLIHQLRFLGSQKHSQSVPLITSFSTSGTQTSLAEINLEFMRGWEGVVTFFEV